MADEDCNSGNLVERDARGRGNGGLRGCTHRSWWADVSDREYTWWADVSDREYSWTQLN
uniref:Uncharacterized protein n=1 Tax=Oryza sativa subsp. japonica TaxID=39947 RepID=Q75KU7_ORYSJ|nr:hypothetical protein [Oryza sativa Japonica Group]